MYKKEYLLEDFENVCNQLIELENEQNELLLLILEHKNIPLSIKFKYFCLFKSEAFIESEKELIELDSVLYNIFYIEKLLVYKNTLFTLLFTYCFGKDYEEYLDEQNKDLYIYENYYTVEQLQEFVKKIMKKGYIGI